VGKPLARARGSVTHLVDSISGKQPAARRVMEKAPDVVGTNFGTGRASAMRVPVPGSTYSSSTVDAGAWLSAG